MFDILPASKVAGILSLGVGHADHPDEGNFPTTVVGPGLETMSRGDERAVTPACADSPANTLRTVPSAELTRAGLLFGNGDPKPTPVFPVELGTKTTPDGRNLVVVWLYLSLDPRLKTRVCTLLSITRKRTMSSF